MIALVRQAGLLLVLATSLSLQAAALDIDVTGPAGDRPQTTYQRFLPLAVAGDPAIQHFLGYMFFYGEGVEQNYDEAHYWFHLSAEEGELIAQRDLGVFHAGAIARIPRKFYDAAEANLWFSLAAANPANGAGARLASRAYDRFLRPQHALLAGGSDASGEILFQAHCAGCHGFTGDGAYAEAPSFARGERLDRSDGELVDGILHGHGPRAFGKAIADRDSARNLLGYIRDEFGGDPLPDSANAPRSARSTSAQLLRGEQAYLRFCGGCHGFNGIAWYVNSPSFALRERLDKSDAELAHSITNGRGAMPSWEYMLKPAQIDALVQFIRTLAPGYERGILGELRRPEQFLRFRPSGESGPEWTADDIR